MKIFQGWQRKSPGKKSTVGGGSLWSSPRFSLRQYSLVVVGLLVLAGGIVLFAATPGNVPDNSIAVSPGASHSLSPDFLGFNADSSSAAWTNPTLLPAVSALAPENIRGIFGGTPSDYFNWQTGQGFIPGGDPAPGSPIPPYTLTNYVNALKAGNADAIFNLNVMTYCPVSNTAPASTSQAGASCTQAQACGPNPAAYTTSCTNTDETWGLDYQIALLEAAKAQGVPIKYIELGNELYLTNSTYQYYFPTVQAYINKVNAWIPILKADFPGAQIGVVGDGSCQPLATAGVAWNQAIDSGVHGEDGITFHEYYANDFPTGSVNNASQLAQMLSTSTQNCSGVLQNITKTYLPSGVTAWITEWNLWSGGTGTGVVLGSWAQGLTNASFALDLARDTQVELTVKHDLVGTQLYGSLFQSTNGYSTKAEGGPIGTPTPLPTTQAFGMTAGGFALSALERSLHGATSTTPLNFSASPDIAGTSAPGLMGQSFTVGGKTNLYFVNLTANDESLNLGSLSGYYSVLQYVSSPSNFVTGNSSIPADSSTASSTVTVPAYSVTSLVSTPAPPAASSSSQPTTAVSNPASSSSTSASSASSGGTNTNSSATASTTPKAGGSNTGNQVSFSLGGHTITVHNSLLKGIIVRYKANKWLPITTVLLLIIIVALTYVYHLPKLVISVIRRLINRLKGPGASA
jgi:hypothetical protein